MFDDHSPLEAVAFVLLILFLATAPIPYGGVTDAGALKIEISAFTIAALSLLGKRRALEEAHLPIWAMVAAGTLGIFQLVPLDAATLERLSPTTASIYSSTNGILHLFGDPQRAIPRLSIAPTDTIRATLLIFAYIALFVAAARLARTRVQRRILCYALVGSAIMYIVYATSSWWGEDVMGGALRVTDAPGYQNRLHGVFVNPNHLAGYLEIGLAIAFGLIWAEIVTSRDRGMLIRDRTAAFEKRFAPIAWVVIVWAIIAAGIGLTKSRMGITAAAIATCVLVILAVVHRIASAQRRRMTVTTIVALLLGVAVVAMITREQPLLRFLATDPRDPGADARIRAWHVSMDAWRQFPTFGSGLGTFREAFRRVQPYDLEGLWEQAHNDSLQMLVTGGWVGLALTAISIASLIILLAHGYWTQRHREESAIALGALGAVLSLVIHGLAEFNFSIPAIPATLAVIAGIGWAAAKYRVPGELA